MVEELVEFLHGHDIVKITLVVLQNQGDLVDIAIVVFEVFYQVVQAFEVLLFHGNLGIGHKNDAVDPGQDRFAGGVVVDLPWNRVDLETGFKTAHIFQFNRQKIKKEGAVGIGCQRDQFASLSRI